MHHKRRLGFPSPRGQLPLGQIKCHTKSHLVIIIIILFTGHSETPRRKKKTQVLSRVFALPG